MNLLLRLKNAAARRFRSIFHVAPANLSPAQTAALRKTLQYWDIPQVTSLIDLGGRASSNYAFNSLGRDYVLRYYTGPLMYLRYQLRVIEHLVKSGFPYSVPRVRHLADGSEYLSDESGYWIVYDLIPGRPVTNLFEISRAEEVGALVSHFHSAMANFSLGSEEGAFVLPMFQTSQVVEALISALPDTCGSKMSREHRNMLEGLTKHYIRIPDSVASAVTQLPKQTIYNDWHGWNMLQTRRRITGLIDFDSIVEAPRVVDVQNALGFILMSAHHPSKELIHAFLRQYKQRCPFGSEETLLIQSVTIDRILQVIGDIQREPCGDGSRIELAGRLVRFLHWIVSSGELTRWLENDTTPI